jgi:hypothetical protein
MHSTKEILNNVVWLVNALDDDALAEVQDIPFLEMAKVVTIAPLPAGFTPSARALRNRLRPQYPTLRKRGGTKTHAGTNKPDEGGTAHDQR